MTSFSEHRNKFSGWLLRDYRINKKNSVPRCYFMVDTEIQNSRWWKNLVV